MSGAGFTIEEFDAVVRLFLLGFARVKTPAGVIFHHVSISRRNGVVWAKPAGSPRIGSDGRQQKDASGRRLWNQVITFATPETEARFSAAVVEALQRSHPQVLGEGGG